MRRLLGSAAALAVVSVSTALAGTAQAAPAGVTVYAFASSGGQLIDVNAETGVSTTIGPDGLLGSSYGTDLDSSTGLLYAYEDDEPCLLWSIDAATGVQTEIGEITDGVDSAINCDGVDVPAPGVVWVLSGDGEMYRVDPATAAILETVTITGADGELAFIATDPTTGIMWLGNYDTILYTLDTTTGVATEEVDLSSENYVESADFDDNGTLVITTDGDACGQGIRSLNPRATDPLATLSPLVDIRVGADCAVDVYSVAVDGVFPVAVVEPEPPQEELANTGAPSSPEGVALAAGALLLAGAGALLVARRHLARAAR